MNATATASLFIAQGITTEISTEGLGDLLAASEETIGLDVDAVREAMADLLGTFTAEENLIGTLTSDELHGSWSVRDSWGGVWWPDDAASSEIEASTDPAAEAVRICREAPYLGKWFQ